MICVYVSRSFFVLDTEDLTHTNAFGVTYIQAGKGGVGRAKKLKSNCVTMYLLGKKLSCRTTYVYCIIMQVAAEREITTQPKISKFIRGMV